MGTTDKRRPLAPEDPRHGTATGYSNHACRCQPCRAAHAEYQQLARLRRQESGNIPHGSSNGYNNYGCRCESCRTAAREEVRRSGREQARSKDPRRGMYRRWYNMLRRCEDPASARYASYGARGIAVCDRWHDFELYLTDIGFPPGPGLSIDRIDNDGNYEPGNVRWATALEQRLNQRERRTYWPYLAECGTEGAYKRHLRYGETPCDDCKAAHAKRQAQRGKRYSLTCDICGRRIAGSNTNLRSHKERKHADETRRWAS